MRKITAGFISLVGISIVVGLLVVLLQNRAPQTVAVLDSPLPTPTVREPEPTRKPTVTPVKATPTPPIGPPRFWAQDIEIGEAIPLTDDKQLAGGGYSIAWSPDGSQIAYSRLTGEYESRGQGFSPITSLWLLNIANGNLERLSKIGGNPRWSPQGHNLVYMTWQHDLSGTVILTNIQSHTRNTFADNAKAVGWINERKLAVNRNGKIEQHDVIDSTAYVIVETLQDTTGPNVFEISPTGKWIAYVNGRQLRLRSIENPDKTTNLTDYFDNVSGGLKWSPTGDRIAFTADGGIWVSFLTSESSEKIYAWPGRGTPGALSWSPDGNVLAFHGPDGISLINVDGSGYKSLIPYETEPETSYLYPVWSPDGKKMLVEKNSNIWMLEILVLTGGTEK